MCLAYKLKKLILQSKHFTNRNDSKRLEASQMSCDVPRHQCNGGVPEFEPKIYSVRFTKKVPVTTPKY